MFKEGCPVLTVMEKAHTSLRAVFAYLTTEKAGVTLLEMIPR